MGYWNYSNIGFMCEKKNEKQVYKLLECIGIDFDEWYGSEAGEINALFFRATRGCNNSELKPSEIYAIVNRIFENTTILYESEEGNNTSDYYSRYEEIYDPKTNKKLIGEKEYCYDGYEVFGQSAYMIIREECEEAAREHNIPIKWTGYYPDGEEFYYLCERILEAHGGLTGLGTKQWTEDIPTVDIKKETIISLIDCAAKHGKNSLVELITKSYDIEYVSPYLSDSQEDKGYSAEIMFRCAESVRGKLEELGNKFELQGTQYEGRSDRIEIIKIGEKLSLLREPENDYDPNAIDVRWGSDSMGHLPWAAAEILADPLDDEMIDAIAEVVEVIPLSKRSKKCKKGLLYVKIIVNTKE